MIRYVASNDDFFVSLFFIRLFLRLVVSNELSDPIISDG